MMYLGMVMQGRARGKSPPLTVIVSTKSFYAWGAEGRELASSRACVLRLSLTHGCCERALLHMSRRSVRSTLSIIAR